MPHRLLPRTDIDHLEVLESAQRKLASLTTTERRLLSPATEARLTKLLPRFRAELTGRDDVVGRQTEATSAARRKKKELRLYVRHFYKALNMAIERGNGFRPGDRTYYGLDATDGTLPKLVREADLLRVAQTLIDGEARRVAAGGKRLTMPSAKEIARLLREVRELLSEKKQLVATVDREREDVIRLRGEVADLVRDIWDELEFALRKDPAPARRRRCREWGVVYGERRGREENGAEESVRTGDSEKFEKGLSGVGPAVPGPHDSENSQLPGRDFRLGLLNNSSPLEFYACAPPSSS